MRRNFSLLAVFYFSIFSTEAQAQLAIIANDPWYGPVCVGPTGPGPCAQVEQYMRMNGMWPPPPILQAMPGHMAWMNGGIAQQPGYPQPGYPQTGWYPSPTSPPILPKPGPHLPLTPIPNTQPADANAFVVTTTRINPEMAPNNFAEVLQQCGGNEICAGAVDAAAAYLGVPPGYVSGALAAVALTRQDNSEETFYDLTLPAGYAYCRTEVTNYSITPFTGDRASVMRVESVANGLKVYTWTPKQGYGGGRSWVDSEVRLMGVKTELQSQQQAAGKCSAPGKTLVNCRGGAGVNNGMPACGAFSE